MTVLKLSKPLLLLALALALPAHAEPVCPNPGKQIEPSHLRFSLTHSQVPGQLAITEHVLNVQGDQYKLSSVSQAKGMLAVMFSGQLLQNSEGVIDPKVGLVPRMYSEKRGKKPVAEVVVDNQQTITFRKNNTTAPFSPGLQDRLSMVYQLSALLKCSASTPKTGEVWPLKVMSTGRVTPEQFVMKGTEELTLNLPQGNKKVTAIQFETKPENADDDLIRVWYAKSMGWVPVRIQVAEQDGKSITQTLVGTGPQE